MPHTMRLPLTSTDKGEVDAGMLALALANGAPCSGSPNTETLAVAPVVLMNKGERQVGCRECVLLIDLCIEERRLLGGTSLDELM